MSEWFEVKNKEDVEVSKDRKDLEILFNTNDWGNQYIIVPIEFIKNAMMDWYETKNQKEEIRC